MTGSSTTPQVLGATTTAAGVTALPNTSGHTVGRILALTAITIGASAIVSQVVVRIVRSKSL